MSFDEYYELSEDQKDLFDQDTFFGDECEAMTVGELMEQLRELDPTLPVHIRLIGYSDFNAEVESYRGDIESVAGRRGEGVLLQGRDFRNYREWHECDHSGCGYCGDDCDYKDNQTD